LTDPQIVTVDLNEAAVEISPWTRARMGRLLGGRGYNVEMLYRFLPAGTDPLGPENVLLLSCGLLTGTRAPASSRVHINALSPQTRLLGSSNVGGYFGKNLRAAGIQSLIIRGRSERPVYLYIDGGRVVLRDAAGLWGLETPESIERIKANHPDEKPSVLTIGPAGENLTLFAGILTDQGHAAGRTGMGAVMGSKNLKAIAVRGRNQAGWKQDDTVKAAVRDYAFQIRKAPEFRTLSRYGGSGYISWANEKGFLATRNYRENRFEGANRLDGRRLARYKTRSLGCSRCPVQCKAELCFPDGPLKGERMIRPEFETMVSLGSKCGLGDPGAVVRLDDLCARLGLDTISAGSAVAFAMDLFDRGILDLEKTGGLDLSWGNEQSMETLLAQTARHEGLGALLALGVEEAARRIGPPAEVFAPHVKGLECSAYHPYYLMATALGYAVSSRGGDFNHFFPSIEYIWDPDRAQRELGTRRAVVPWAVQGKGRLVRRSMLVNIVLDSLGLCKVPALSLIGAFDLVNESRLTRALTGLDLTPAGLFERAERIALLERLFNLRHGLNPSRDDTLPALFFQSEARPGAEPVQRPDWLRSMVLDFYGAMGWDENGIPGRACLKRFSIPEPTNGASNLKKSA